MKIRISSHNLNALLKDVTRATEAKAVVTWMSGVLIETDGDRIKAVCTNGTQTIIRYAECQTDVEGKVLLDAKLLLNVASKLPSCTCVLDATSGKKVVIKAEESKTNMALMDADAFVLPASVEKKFSFTCIASKLFNAFKNVLYATPVQDTRATLTGVNIQSKNDTVHLCGMDGFRMGISKVEAQIEGEDFNIIIPRKSVVDIMGVFPADESELTIASDGKHIFVSNGATEMNSQLVAGEYVKYKQIITNTKTSCKAMFNTQQLKDAISRAMVMCEGKNNLLKLVVDTDGVTVSGMGDVGDSTELVGCVVNGDGLEVGFNGRLLFEAINAISEDEAVFQFSSSVGPAMLTSVDRGGWMHVVLPVRV